MASVLSSHACSNMRCGLQERSTRRHERRQDNPFEQRYVRQCDIFRGRNHYHHTERRGRHSYFAYKRESRVHLTGLLCFKLLRVQICGYLTSRRSDHQVTDSRCLQEQYEKNMHGLVGSLFDPSEEEDIPLLYFHSFYSCFKWLCSWMIPGLGMFSEAYFIFSIGNIKPILGKQFPNCWTAHKVRQPFVAVIL